MHLLLERFQTRQAVRDVLRRGQRNDALDPHEQALWRASLNEPRVAQVLLESFDEEGDALLGDSAADVLRVEAAADLSLREKRLAPAAVTLQAACRRAELDASETRSILGLAIAEEAFERPHLPGSFDAEWVSEAMSELTRTVELGREGLEVVAARAVAQARVGSVQDCRRVCEALLEELFAEGPSLLSREVVARGLEACGDEIESPHHESSIALAFIEALAGAGVVGPRRLVWLGAALRPVPVATAA